MTDTPTCRALIQSAKELCVDLRGLRFGPPVTHVYNPLLYAWAAHEEYLRRYGSTPKRVVFVGMNPGPFGMTQTGVPFGEIAAVRDWLKIQAPIGKPEIEHPKRPIDGFDCQRSEVSGKRLWGLFAERFGTPEEFFREHFVANYCPLVFCEASGCNRTPDKIPAAEIGVVIKACDRHLMRVIEALKPEWAVGVGDFAEKRVRSVLEKSSVKIGKILHPSPASPNANQNWAEKATQQLRVLGVWK
jgi:single-strand selective monofunctional uracil DNA glycosylase